MGLRRLGHALRHVPAGRPAARRVRARRRRRRGAPPDRHGRRRRAPLPVGRRRRLRPSCATHIEERGLRVGAVNPNLFQDPDYKLGLDHPSRRAGAREGRRAPARVPRDRRRRSARPPSRSGWPTAPTTRARTTCASAAARLLEALAEVYDAAAPRAGAAGRVQALRARLLRDRPRGLGLGAPRLPEARRPRARARRPRPPRAGRQRRADRRAARRRRAGSAASTSTTASTPTTT